MERNNCKPFKSIFRQVPKWQDLWFYQKTEVLYQLTYVFCERFLPQYGDRTVDQMVQVNFLRKSVNFYRKGSQLFQ